MHVVNLQDRSRDVMDPWIQGISIVGSRVDHGLDQSRAYGPWSTTRGMVQHRAHMQQWLLAMEPAEHACRAVQCRVMY